MKKFRFFRSIPDPVVISIAVLSVVLHLLIANNLEYHRDELLYFTLGQHPATGYASVPPLIGWISWLIQTLLGNSVFAVRLFPALLGGALIIMTAAISRELGGSRYASFLASLGVLISIFFLRTYFLFHPVHIDIFLWTLCIFLIIKYINTSEDHYLLFLGIAAGISLLNKYLAGLLFFGLIVFIPFTRYRDVFRKRMFYMGIAACFLIFLPNLIWQISKGFPVFNHLDELYSTQLVFMSFPLFLTEQIIMSSAASFLTISGLLYLVTSKESQKFRLLGFIVIFVIIVLMLLKGKSYYTLGVFPLLIAAGAVSYENWIRRIWLRILFPVFLVILTIPIVPFGIPVYKSIGLKKYFNVLGEKYGIDLGRRFEDGSIHSLPQDYADMLGWEELTEITAKAWQMIKDKNAAFIYGENYGQASAITVIGKKYGLPDAISFSESYRYWIPIQFDPDITSVVYINGELGKDINSFFRKITIVGSISNPDAREYGTTVYLCEDPVASFNEFWKRRLEELKLGK
jgi:hypothetical protein